ncbi:hypothetical protein P9112_003435 [Eukaryota sp. TZLM1-RC]
MNSHDVVNHILNFYQSSGHTQHESHQYLLSIVDHPQLQQILPELLSHSSPHVVFWAAQSIDLHLSKTSTTPDPSFLPLLLSLLTSPFPQYITTKLCVCLAKLSLLLFPTHIANPLEELYPKLQNRPDLFLQYLRLLIEEADTLRRSNDIYAKECQLFNNLIDNIISYCISMLDSENTVLLSLQCLDSWLNASYVSLNKIPEPLLSSTMKFLNIDNYCTTCLHLYSAICSHPLRSKSSQYLLINFFNELLNFLPQSGIINNYSFEAALLLRSVVDFYDTVVGRVKEVDMCQNLNRMLLKSVDILSLLLTDDDCSTFEASCDVVLGLVNVECRDEETIKEMRVKSGEIFKLVIHQITKSVEENFKMSENSKLIISIAVDAFDSLFVSNFLNIGDCEPLLINLFPVPFDPLSIDWQSTSAGLIAINAVADYIPIKNYHNFLLHLFRFCKFVLENNFKETLVVYSLKFLTTFSNFFNQLKVLDPSLTDGLMNILIDLGFRCENLNISEDSRLVLLSISDSSPELLQSVDMLNFLLSSLTTLSNFKVSKVCATLISKISKPNIELHIQYLDLVIKNLGVTLSSIVSNFVPENQDSVQYLSKIISIITSLLKFSSIEILTSVNEEEVIDLEKEEITVDPSFYNDLVNSINSLNSIILVLSSVPEFALEITDYLEQLLAKFTPIIPRICSGIVDIIRKLFTPSPSVAIYCLIKALSCSNFRSNCHVTFDTSICRSTSPKINNFIHGVAHEFTSKFVNLKFPKFHHSDSLFQYFDQISIETIDSDVELSSNMCIFFRKLAACDIFLYSCEVLGFMVCFCCKCLLSRSPSTCSKAAKFLVDFVKVTDHTEVVSQDQLTLMSAFVAEILVHSEPQFVSEFLTLVKCLLRTQTGAHFIRTQFEVKFSAEEASAIMNKLFSCRNVDEMMLVFPPHSDRPRVFRRLTATCKPKAGLFQGDSYY